jgi:hypothetical protein
MIRRAGYFPLLILLLLSAGCSTLADRGIEGHVPVQKSVTRIPEDRLLDVWIELFDPGTLPVDEDASGLSMDIREAEARYLPEQLRSTMEKTGYWGAVRVVPGGTEGGEVLVQGTILASDGEQLALAIIARDASGRVWLERTYRAQATPEDYEAAARSQREVFQSLFNTIANDLAQYRSTLVPADALAIRRVAEMRFASELAPDAFGGYLLHDSDGRYRVKHLPARDDPMYRRVRAIRERDFLLIDTLDGHFDNFSREMQQPYFDWRKARTEEATALQAIERDALKRKLLGIAAIAGAIAIEASGRGNGASAGVLRDTMVLGGVYAIKSGFDKGSEAQINRDAIEELGESFSSEARPLVVEVEGETHELTGSAEVQYAKWRALLKRIYASETGLPGTPD